MVKRSSTLIKEGKITRGIDEERLHRTKEKNREKLFPKEKRRNGKDKLRQHMKQPKERVCHSTTEPWGQNEGIASLDNIKKPKGVHGHVAINPAEPLLCCIANVLNFSWPLFPSFPSWGVRRMVVVGVYSYRIAQEYMH